MALISLEDLEGLDEEQLDDDITEDPQPMAEEEEDRLLTHWQAVASNHQVLVPPEMMGPIMEMTRNSQQRELLPFSSICCHEKMGEVQFEERLIPPGQWACVSDGEKLFEQSVSVSFMKLMRYICRENSTGRFLGLTVPVVTEVSADGLSMQEVVRTSFFLPSEFQSTPPLPSDPDITIVQREPIRVLSRTFFGTTTWQTLTYQVGILRSLLGAPPLLGTPPLLGAPPLLGGPPLLGSPPLLGAPPLLENFMVASYENPSVPERRNEIWILPRDL